MEMKNGEGKEEGKEKERKRKDEERKNIPVPLPTNGNTLLGIHAPKVVRPPLRELDPDVVLGPRPAAAVDGRRAAHDGAVLWAGDGSWLDFQLFGVDLDIMRSCSGDAERGEEEECR